MRFPRAGARLAFSAVPSVTRSVDFSDFQLDLIRDPEIWYNATIIMLRAAFRATPQQHASARPGQFGAPMRFLFLFTVAAFALAGCTADQMLSQPLQPLPPGTPRAVCSAYNPIQYAQTCGFYFGGHGHRSH